uniref:Uncharacterized protein n=1 Tax=Cacopsylla melanoneura TaxID=428564 RepID=A0A8D9AVC0_9HEMI
MATDVLACAGHGMTASAITLALSPETANVYPAGPGTIAPKQNVCPAVMSNMDIVTNLTNAYVAVVGKASSVINASVTQAVCTALAINPGSACVMKAGAVCSATKI